MSLITELKKEIEKLLREGVPKLRKNLSNLRAKLEELEKGEDTVDGYVWESLKKDLNVISQIIDRIDKWNN